MMVSVVIPNLNGKHLLEDNLPFVFKAVQNIKNQIVEVIVVDDASTDGSVTFLQKNYKGKLRLVKHSKNRGFSSAVNTGVRASRGDLILLLNTDVIPDDDFLVSTLPLFKDKKVFAVSVHEKGYGGARGFFENGYIQLGMLPESKAVSRSFYVSGGSGIFRSSVWKLLGGMDENLLSPFYWEDLDICYRAAKRGFTNLWDPNSHVVHRHESTISKLDRNYVSKIKERNQLLCVWKNIHSKTLIRKHIAGLLSRLASHPRYVIVLIMALLKFPKVLKARKKEIKESKLSDEAVFAQFS